MNSQKDKKKYERGMIAFTGPKIPDRGYTVCATYLEGEHQSDALVEIFKDGKKVRKFLFPAYKIYNISAHFGDIVDSEIRENADGYNLAASTGF